MSSPFLGTLIIDAIAGTPTTGNDAPVFAPEIPLAPIVPGSFAAWASAGEATTPAATTSEASASRTQVARVARRLHPGWGTAR